MSNAGRPRSEVGVLGFVTVKVVVAKDDPKKKEHLASGRVRDAAGVTRKLSAHGRTDSIARDALTAKAKALRAKRTGAVTKSTTVGELVDLYLAALPATKLEAQTKARYTQSARKHIRPEFEGLTSEELEAGDVLVFLEKLAVDHLSEARTCRVVLKAIMQQSIRAKVIKQNPVTESGVQLAVPRSKPRAASDDDLHRLRQAVASWRTGPDVRGPKPTNDLLELIDVMLGTTTRIGEALAIRAEDVRIDDAGTLTVEICGTIIWEAGVGTYRKSTPKNDASWRIVTPPDFAADVLRRRAHFGEWSLLFATKHGTPFLQQNLGRSLRAAVKGTDLDWITSHILRKTSATTIDRKDSPESRKDAARALGHEGETLAGTTYIPRDRMVPDSREALDALAPRVPAEAFEE